MKTRTRFIRSVIKSAQTCDTTLPFQRGLRRAAPRPAPARRRASA